VPDEVYVERVLVPERALNGGFFDPPPGEPVRVVAAQHALCGERTRVRLPAAVPARLVRRVRCDSCAQDYDAEVVEEIGVEEIGVEDTSPVVIEAPPEAAAELGAAETPLAAVEPPAEAAVEAPPEPPKARRRLSLPSPSLPRPRLPKLNPGGRFWRVASVPLAAAAMLAGLYLLQGETSTPVSSSDPAQTGVAADAAADAGEKGSGERDVEESAAAKKSEMVSSSQFSLALPAGWERVEPPAGATFAAVAADGGADATLWIDENPDLDLPTFISQSMAQLEALAGAEPRIIERVPGPTPETTSVRLAADAPPGQPAYEVTLRAAGPYFYYLATTIEPDASRDAIAGAELNTGSFAPQTGAGE